MLRTTTILAVALAFLGACDIIDPPVPGSLLVEPTWVVLEVGQSAQVTVQILDQHGQPLDDPPRDFRPTWSVDDEHIATVDDDGLITALATGPTTVHVRAGRLRAEIGVRVQ